MLEYVSRLENMEASDVLTIDYDIPPRHVDVLTHFLNNESIDYTVSLRPSGHYDLFVEGPVSDQRKFEACYHHLLSSKQIVKFKKKHYDVVMEALESYAYNVNKLSDSRLTAVFPHEDYAEWFKKHMRNRTDVKVTVKQDTHK